MKHFFCCLTELFFFFLHNTVGVRESYSQYGLSSAEYFFDACAPKTNTFRAGDKINVTQKQQGQSNICAMFSIEQRVQ